MRLDQLLVERGLADSREKARRLISAGGGFLFKGSGFYITDYRSDSYKKSAAADTKPSSGGESKSESTRSEAKSSGESSSKSTAGSSSEK